MKTAIQFKRNYHEVLEWLQFAMERSHHDFDVMKVSIQLSREHRYVVPNVEITLTTDSDTTYQLQYGDVLTRKSDGTLAVIPEYAWFDWIDKNGKSE